SFPPNALGLYDVSGNVYEWCWDWYIKYSFDAQEDPKGPDTDEEAYDSWRALRGGAWQAYTDYIRCVNRRPASPDDRYNFFGFRLARGLSL
ncbi:MAG: SUMF1/EgtB/PvdO family nonheme iron enzyme, partial [Bacteroidetes bacterium]|nr:SUMF1/EgtB/PvdO family nonheme iron enzyme [Bacteroidota bacterium]